MACIAWGWPSADQVEAAAAAIGGVVTLASAFCAATPTPPPGSRWAKLYRAIEVAALLVGRAKQTGVIPPAPALDDFAKRAAEFAKSMRGPAALAMLLLALGGGAAPPASLAVLPPPRFPAPSSLRAAATFFFDQDADGRLIIRSLTSR